jgi:hypothetical protein
MANDLVQYDGGGLPAPSEPARELSVEDYLNDAWDGLYSDDDGDVVRMPDDAEPPSASYSEPAEPAPEEAQQTGAPPATRPTRPEPDAQRPGTIDQALRPLDAELRELGINRVDAVNRLVRAHQILRYDLGTAMGLILDTDARPIDPRTAVRLVKAIAARAGMAADAGSWDAQAADPMTHQRFAHLQVTAIRQSAQAKLDAFVAAKDARGRLLHPDYEARRGRMADLMAAARKAGQAMTLHEAYAKAGGKGGTKPAARRAAADTVEGAIRDALAQMEAA